MKNAFAALGALAVIAAVGYVAYNAGLRNAPVSTAPAPEPTTPPEPPTPPDPLPPKVEPTPTLPADEHVRQVLRPGYTYQTHLKGTIRGPAENKKWAIKTVVDVIYTFEAFIDREIVSNDGTMIVEIRHFNSVRSLDVHGKLKDVKIELGPPGKLLYAGLLMVYPKAAAVVKHIDGLSMAPVLQWLEGLSVEKFLGIDAQLTEAFAVADALTGKSVRMEYIDGKGIVDVKDVRGISTPDERAFHNASILVSDALLFPDPEKPVGGTWEVDGRAFNHLIDPSLRATVSGRVKFARLPDEDRSGKKLRVLSIVKPARYELEGSHREEGRVGHVEPEGKMYFSPEDKIIVEAELGGSGVLHRFSKNHLLFETSFRGAANVEAKYACRLIKTEDLKAGSKGGAP